MGHKAVLLLALTVLQSVLGQIVLPEPPYRLFSGLFTDFEKPRVGKSRLDIHGEKITNITTYENWRAGNVTIDILDGGVGYDYVSFSYEVTANAQGNFATLIFTTEPTFSTDQSQERSFFKDDPPEFLDFTFSYNAVYNSSNSSRTDIVSFSFDKAVSGSYGYSTWWNGNGSREIKGGFPDNYLDIVLYIPENVSGSSYYTSWYPNGVPRSRNVGTSQSLQEAGDVVGLHQIYDTLEYVDDEIHGTTEYNIHYEILSFEGGIHWENGTSPWNVTAGGVGFDYIEFGYDQTAYTYGILDFNLVVKGN